MRRRLLLRHVRKQDKPVSKLLKLRKTRVRRKRRLLGLPLFDWHFLSGRLPEGANSHLSA
jgi:hypothetical protein